MTPEPRPTPNPTIDDARGPDGEAAYFGEALGDFLAAAEEREACGWDDAPAAQTPAQGAAKDQLAGALLAFCAAFGPGDLRRQLEFAVTLTGFTERLSAIGGRVRTARAPLLREAELARAEGDEELARECDAAPTPDYPGKADDEAWLLSGASANPGRGPGSVNNQGLEGEGIDGR